jgi:hypothetical protein
MLLLNCCSCEAGSVGSLALYVSRQSHNEMPELCTCEHVSHSVKTPLNRIAWHYFGPSKPAGERLGQGYRQGPNFFLTE